MRFLMKLMIVAVLGALTLGGAYLYTLYYIVPQKEKLLPPDQETSLLVHTPLMQRVIIKNDKNQWCIVSEKKCGTMQVFEHNAFQLTWEDGSNTQYEYIKDLGYAQKRHNKIAELLPERKGFKVKLGDEVLSLNYEKEGSLTDSEGKIRATLISQSSVFVKALKRYLIHLYLKLPDGTKQMFLANEKYVFEPIDFEEKSHKIFTFTPSFRRPIFLAGQLARLRGQTYQNFDMRVALKGFDSSAYELTFLKEWQDLIDSGRLILTFDKNEKFYQLVNVVDSMKNIDLDKYDYGCKIDDDDWYAPDYLETINRHLSLLPDIASTRFTRYFRMTNQGDKAVYTNHTANVSGATFCLRTDVIKKLFDVVKLPDDELMDRIHEEKYRAYELKKGGDDVIMHAIAQETGDTMVIDTPVPLFLNGAQFSSVTRDSKGKVYGTQNKIGTR